MAEAGISVDQFSVDQFSCPICLDLLKDPVATPCGHSFCKVCINGCWDQEDQRGIYSCPQCRETFSPRPVLHRNTMLAEVVEKLKKTELQAASPAHCYAGSGDVECDFCTGRKLKAIKSCLMCLASFCETHLKPHYEVPAWKKHTLVEACAELQEKICSQHDKVIEIYCRSDKSFICYLCTIENHKGHNTVTVKTERAEKQSELKEEQRKSQQRIQEKQKKVQELNQTVNNIKSHAQAAVEDNERIFTDLIRYMKKKCSEVTKLIQDQEKSELNQAEQLLQQLNQEIVDLKSRVTELEQLTHTHDHIHFLQSLPSLFGDSRRKDSPSITVNENLSFDEVTKSLSKLKERLEKICEDEINKITLCAAGVQRSLPSESLSREDFLQYFCQLTLDPNTAQRNLILSEKNKVVTYSNRAQPYSESYDSYWQERNQLYFSSPRKADPYSKVLCKERVSGRCYWEVEWSGGDVDISVSYNEISRNACKFGSTNQSWSLRCSSSSSSSSFSFYHNNRQAAVKGPPPRIGVYVDHSAGTLSFYSISDTMRLLHRVQTTFTQPLYAGFGVWASNSTARLCDPK